MVKVQQTFVVVSAALLQTALQREAVITNTVEGAEHVDTFPIFTNLNRVNAASRVRCEVSASELLEN